MKSAQCYAMIENRGSITSRARMCVHIGIRLALACLALLTSASVLVAQEPRTAVDVAAEEFRRIVEMRGTLPDDVRARWLYAVFDTATRSYRRDQPMDTLTDSAGELAIYRRLRLDWDQGDLARWESALDALHSIDRARLTERDALSHDIMRSEVTGRIALAKAPAPYLPLTNNRGLHLNVWLYASEWMPSNTLADYELLLGHLNGIALEINGMMQGMRQAHGAGVMPPQYLMTDVRDALADMIVVDPMKSGYLAKFSEFPGSIAAPEQERLRASAERIYTTKIRPAYERLLTYATETYIPAATRDMSFSTLPGAAERYAVIVRLLTAPADLSPAQLHQTGLDDVALHTAAIDSFRVAVDYQGTYYEFLEFLRTDSRFEFEDSAAYVRAARDVAKRIDANVFRMFYTVPRLPFGIEGVHGVGGAVHRRGSLADARPGMVALFLSSDRPGRTWLLPAMMLHEGVPGHHFSHALSLERDPLPLFRQSGSIGTFTEGWAMYAESMGRELGVYDDEYAAFGQLAGNMNRAVRLVLDTGINGLGWTWQEAVDYARRHSPWSQAQIEGEAGRVMGRPGFVLGYKIGQRKFMELRALAERGLGASFDVRAFHDALLENGDLPLDVLDAHMRAWVARRAPSPK